MALVEVVVVEEEDRNRKEERRVSSDSSEILGSRDGAKVGASLKAV